MFKIIDSKFNLEKLFYLKKITRLGKYSLLSKTLYFIYQSILDKVAVVIDRLDLVILKVPVCGVLNVIELRCILVNSSGDKSENSVIP